MFYIQLSNKMKLGIQKQVEKKNKKKRAKREKQRDQLKRKFACIEKIQTQISNKHTNATPKTGVFAD